MEVESGFINSQPSMAEFMTALPHIGDSFGGSTAINGGTAQPGTAPETTEKPYGGGGTAGNVNVPEYPWMKEKKTTRKQQQGNDRINERRKMD
ncbi:hypothetical protein JTE90_024216 [Oedothorax gibbosus]|uniref:Homeotic protein proboscipedia n=1 Tax=Oedothorax gibbosus TaxID=931172 RepID=A0AAV6UAL3_9ARAC|nr:hypothetical protein JTE90_024216 [Oedothorax gibbosus]